MSIDIRKHEAPAAGETPRRKSLNDLSLSIRDVVPVSGPTAEAQLVADLTAAGYGPSVSNPLYTFREDLQVERVTIDGTKWRRVGPFAQDEGTATFPTPAGNGQAIQHIAQVTFDAGAGFTVPPVVTSLVLVTSGTRNSPQLNVAMHAYDRTTTGMKVHMYNSGGAAFSPDGFSAHWQVTQATATSAAG